MSVLRRPPAVAGLPPFADCYSETYCKIRKAMQASKPLSGRPLYANAADERLYVPRSDVEARIERSIERDLNTLLLGERGAGKTTLLQHLLFRARQDSSRPRTVYVDASIARSALDVIDLLRDALGMPPHIGENVTAGLRAIAKPGAAGARDATLLLQRLAPLRDVSDAVVLLDGLASGGIAHTLFGRLRDELWALPLTWIVGADPGQRSQFLTPPADAFFETVVVLPPLDPREQIDVLKRRLPREWRSVEGLAGEDHGNPRQLLSAARAALVNHRPIEEVLEAHAERRTRAASLGRSASTLYAELESLGRPVAASDEELLGRLGVTRERASQVLKQLENHGLLESFTEPAERGRPRKLFRIRDTLASSETGEHE
jgi:energy-coupling factor transporter ATP-binding protein EcfA2